MTPAQADLGRELVRALPGQPVVLGTFGLVLHGLLAPELAADVDVLAAMDDVPGIVAALLERGFHVLSWQDPVTAPPSLAELAGRFYVRGDKDGLVVDVTYEGLELAPWQGDAVNVDGVRVAAVARIVALKRKRGADKDLRILRALGVA